MNTYRMISYCITLSYFRFVLFGRAFVTNHESWNFNKTGLGYLPYHVKKHRIAQLL